MNAKEYKFFRINPNRFNRPRNAYGRCINFSLGLIAGLLIDKCLFIVTKGFSVFIPPFAVMLMSKGKVLYSLRFDREFHPLIERFLKHFISK